MIYNYNRVSSSSQIMDRQVEAFAKWSKENNITEYRVFEDKQSGKDFERKGYQELLSVIQKGDVVVIKSIDRLGRNYDLIISEWTRITKNIGADIVVLDMPLLDTRDKEKNLTGKFISDIVLQLLSYVAETERANIKQRQKEGIAIAKAKGVKFGRDKKFTPERVAEIKKAYDSGMKYVDITLNYDISKRQIIYMAQEHGWKPRNNRKVGA